MKSLAFVRLFFWITFEFMSRYILIICSFICCLNVMGQDYVDLFKFTYLNSPFNKTDSTNDPTRVQEFYIDATLPIKLSSRTAVITGFTLEQLSVASEPTGFNVSAVYSTAFKMGLNQKHGKKWDGTYMLLPKISGDFNNMNDNAFQLGGLALFKFTKKKNLKYRFGMYYNSELFGPFFVPLLGLYYQSKNKKFEANVTLPVWVDLNYKLSKSFTAGANFSAFVRSYYLSPTSTQGRDEYLVKASNEIYGYLQYALKRSHLFQFKAGYSIGRRFSTYDIRDRTTWGFSAFRFGDDRTETNDGVSDGFILQLRYIYRFHLDKDEDKSEELGLK